MGQEVAEKHRLTIICSSCGREWITDHRCDEPPEIDFSHYTDAALERLADRLSLIVEDRIRRAARQRGEQF